MPTENKLPLTDQQKAELIKFLAENPKVQTSFNQEVNQFRKQNAKG